MYFQNKINYALALSGRLGEYHIRTQGVALGYMIRGFQPTGRYNNVSLEMSDEPNSGAQGNKRPKSLKAQKLKSSQTRIVFLADYNASEKTAFNIG